MKITESQLRKIVRSQLKEFRLPEKDLGLNLTNKLSSQEVGKALDDALGRTHASGRKFHSAFLSSLNESKKQAVDMTDDELLKRVYELSKMSESGDLDYKFLQFSDGEEIQSPDLEIVTSILSFTGGHVPSVRNPEAFDATKTNKIKYTYVVPNKSDYQIANVIMTRLASAYNQTGFPNIVYRGITLDQDVAMSLDPGIEFNNWPISSFTIDNQQARDFIRFKDTRTEAGILLSIEQPKFGCYVRYLSVYPSEGEYVLGKKLIIKSVRKPVPSAVTKMYFVDCEIKE